MHAPRQRGTDIDPILRGRGQACVNFLETCMQEHCGPTLTQQHQKAMCLGLWKTVNKPASQPAPTRASGAPPAPGRRSTQPPPMPAAFSERLVTPSIKGSKRMGLQLWWASEGVHTRTEACREGNRCGVYTR